MQALQLQRAAAMSWPIFFLSQKMFRRWNPSANKAERCSIKELANQVGSGDWETFFLGQEEFGGFFISKICKRRREQQSCGGNRAGIFLSQTQSCSCQLRAQALQRL